MREGRHRRRRHHGGDDVPITLTVWIGGVGNAIPFYWDILVVAVFSLVIYYWAVHSRLPEAKVDKYVAEVYPPPLGE